MNACRRWAAPCYGIRENSRALLNSLALLLRESGFGNIAKSSIPRQVQIGQILEVARLKDALKSQLEQISAHHFCCISRFPSLLSAIENDSVYNESLIPFFSEHRMLMRVWLDAEEINR